MFWTVLSGRKHFPKKYCASHVFHFLLLKFSHHSILVNAMYMYRDEVYSSSRSRGSSNSSSSLLLLLLLLLLSQHQQLEEETEIEGMRSRGQAVALDGALLAGKKAEVQTK